MEPIPYLRECTYMKNLILTSPIPEKLIALDKVEIYV